MLIDIPHSENAPVRKRKHSVQEHFVSSSRQLAIILFHGAAFSLDQGIWIRKLGIRQDREITHQIGTVFFYQLVTISEVQRAVGAGVNTGRILSFRTQAGTGIALAGDFLHLVVFRHTVRTDVHTGLAADAHVVVMDDRAVLRLVHGAGRADRDTAVLVCDFMPVVPVITVTAETTILWAVDRESFHKTISAGTWEIPELELRKGENTVYITSEGTTTFKYREGRL